MQKGISTDHLDKVIIGYVTPNCTWILSLLLIFTSLEIHESVVANHITHSRIFVKW